MPRSTAVRKQSSEVRLDFCLAGELKALIGKAAAYSGESLTGFAVSTLVREARRIVQEHETVTLSARDRVRFLELLDDTPPPPTPSVAPPSVTGT